MISLCTNLASKATSQFDNWNFTSYAKIHGQLVATNSEGLFVIGGHTDDGEPVDASFTTASSNFDSVSSKKFPYAYALVKTDTEFELTIEVDNTVNSPLSIPAESTGTQLIRFPISREFRGHQWIFTVRHNKPSGFSFYDLKGLPTILHPGRR